MTCFKTVFQKKLLMKNIGFFLYLILFLLNIICLFLFRIKYWNKLIKKIKCIKINILNEINRKKIFDGNIKTKSLAKRVKFKNKSQVIKTSKKKIKAETKRILPNINKNSKNLILKNKIYYSFKNQISIK
jgi:hypothetical protein